MIKLIFIIIFIICVGCNEKKVVSISKKNIFKDSVKSTLFVNKVLDSTYQKQQFDSLLLKFSYKNITEFDFTSDDRSNIYAHKKFHQLTEQEFNILNISKLYKELGYETTAWYKFCYSVHKLNNGLIGITIAHSRDGVFFIYYLTYKNRKLISFTQYPFASSGGEFGVLFLTRTKSTSDSTFHTVDKITHMGNIIQHSEIITIIYNSGVIKQERRVFADKSVNEYLKEFHKN